MKVGRPELPRIAAGDRVVGIILTDLETIKKSKGKKRLENSQYLIHYISQQLRRSTSKDSLLQTTAIWALINIFRGNPEETRVIMLQAGIPGVLLDVFKAGLSGVSRQYASELCFFLSSNTPYPDQDAATKKNTLPMAQFPDLIVGTHISEETSLGNTGSLDKKHTPSAELTAFAPYRVNEANMTKLTSLFSSGLTKSNQSDILSLDDDGVEMLSSVELGEGFADDQSTNSSDLSKISKSRDMASYRILTNGISERSASDSCFQQYSAQKVSKPKKSNAAKMSARIRTIVAQNERYLQSMPTFAPFSVFDNHEAPRLEVPHGKRGAVAVSPLKTAKLTSSSSQSSSAQIDALMAGLYGSDALGESNDDDDDNLHESEVSVSKASDVNTLIESQTGSMEVAKLLHGQSTALHQLGASSYGKAVVLPSPEPVSTKMKAASKKGRSGSLHYNNTSRYKDRVRTLDSLRTNESNNGSIVGELFSTIDPLELHDTVSGTLRDAANELEATDIDTVDLERKRTPLKGNRESKNKPSSSFDLLQSVEELEDVDTEGEEPLERESDGYPNVDIREPGLDYNQDAYEGEDADRMLEEASPSGPKHMRIKAEKLIDLRFIKRLFNTKTSLAEAQSFVNRLSDLLSLLDAQGTGFVSWYHFTRTVMALAPQGVLRADVEAFMKAQTDDSEDLIDYEEFIISGKVLIVSKFGDKKKQTLPVSAWLERQKLFAGEESTHTWRKHVEWYRTRRSEAVVWLMRRATKAMTQCRVIETCTRELIVIGKRAKAFLFLRETGLCAAKGDKKREDAKKALLVRCLHAKRFVDIRNEAKRYLYYTAQGMLALYRDKVEEEIIVVPPRKPQADYSNLFRLHYLHKATQAWLANRAKRSIDHWVRTVDTMEALLVYGKRAIQQTVIQLDARLWLRERAEQARDYCTFKDSVALWLLRMGKRAYNFLEGQEQAVQWLKKKGQKSLFFHNKKVLVTESLYKQGRFQLERSVSRYHAGKYILKRRQLAEALLKRQAEAIAYLRRIPVSVLSVEGSVAMSNSWLVERGRRAVNHSKNQLKAFRRLQFIAGRSTAVQRKTALAFLWLQQLGRVSVLQTFERFWLQQEGNKQRLNDEKVRLSTVDNRNAARLSLQVPERWEAEFVDVYRWAVRYAPCPLEDEDMSDKISLTGFMRLTMKGKLFSMSKEFIAEEFRSLNKDGYGIVREDDVQEWFLAMCRKRHRRMLNDSGGKGNGFTFKVSDIFTLHERSILALLKRYWGKGEKKFTKVSEDLFANYEEIQSNRAQNLGNYADGSDDDEDDEDEEGENQEDENEGS